MGVLGLWSLLEPVGKPVPVESLAGKVLAVDVSIWLNQAVRGYRDRQGNGVANAHLLGLYHRVCKLLFYRIKPVFVFDGAPPQLKRDTLARRRVRRGREGKAAREAGQKILSNYLARQAVAQRLQRQTAAVDNALQRGAAGLHQLLRGPAARDRDLFELPALPASQEEEEEAAALSSSDSDCEHLLAAAGYADVSDVYAVDVTSARFTSLPANLQYELLHELKGKRKQNSWARLQEMPQQAENFSTFQFERLKRRREIESKLEFVAERLGSEQRAVVDSKLFVGDRAGVKALRLASRPDRQVVFASGLGKEDPNRTGSRNTEAAASSSSSSRAGEVRELRSDEEETVDDPDQIVVLGSEEDISQQEMLNMIKSDQKFSVKKSVSIEDSSDEDVILIPSENVFSSNRAGGRWLQAEVKQEVIEVEEENTEADAELSEESVGVMSDSGDSSSSSDQDDLVEVEDCAVNTGDDLFADVFRDSANLVKLDNIVEKVAVKNAVVTGPSLKLNAEASKTENRLADNILKRLPLLDKPSDILASISNTARKSPTKDCSDNVPVVEKKIEDQEISINNSISQNLKNGPGILMKIASKHAKAEEEKVSPTKKAQQPIVQLDTDRLQAERESLVREMETAEREKRLLRFTEGSASVELETTAMTDRMQDEEDQKQDEEGVVFQSAAPGFVAGGRDRAGKQVVQVESGEPSEVEQPQEELLPDTELLALQARLAEEGDSLVAELGKSNRLAASITDQMYQECQELLQLFGLPWLVAPAEAEAQCALLDSSGMTDGTITDDSDIWLFGGCRVYKNFFDQEKYVEQFSETELVEHLGLTREKLICLALLTGSDYTEGVETVGPVSALEILAEFPGDGITPLQVQPSY